MLKAIVTGAYSTGKSTLIRALGTELRKDGLTIVELPDLARSCPFPLNEAQTHSASLWLLTTQISREIEASRGTETIMLCDRGVPDILAHYGEHVQYEDDPWFTSVSPLSERWISTYDVVLFSQVDENIPIAVDGLRSEDPSYRRLLGARATEVLSTRADAVVLAHDPAERVHQAREAIWLALSWSRSSQSL
ncbi:MULTISPECIES: AAA family ATPase [unclassified Novosphingobium]|uniref:AAA family ATPase n=1 Tax=unclassified Novosphingobium TaxID=2644732 RepID=UPI0025E600D2|nr:MULTISPECIES: AAA family ATPase [unclassified Novosphingobium]HQV04701.1 AAA family ATPase [Novosphingobium sp.]